MLDRRHVAPALLEFVVMADTHFVLAEKSRSGEFETRLFQTARIKDALDLTRGIGPDLVLHLGDLVQEFPGSEDFDEALEQAKRQLDSAELPLHIAPGNHDVGDKPDPTTAAPWTTPEFLRTFEERIGPSWYSFDAGGVHFIIVNTSIMNSDLPAADEQWDWLEADLANNEHDRTVVGLHIPLFLQSRDEPSLGHYDNIAEPARSRLTAILTRSSVDLVFAGHSHFSFLNTIQDTRCYIAPSTSTTRPGFSELFSSPAPPSRGHNDAAKLGMLLVRVYEDSFRVNLIRTHGPAATRTPPDNRQVLLPATAGELPTSNLGVTLRHPVANWAEVPIAFPSAVRQPVRNDYPLLSLVELGTRFVRVPSGELEDEALRERHSLLREHGVSTVVTYLAHSADEVVHSVKSLAVEPETVELVVPLDTCTDSAVDALVKGVAANVDASVSLCKVSLGAKSKTKVHRRQRYGFQPDELDVVEQRFMGDSSQVGRIVVGVEDRDDLWRVVRQMSEGSRSHQVDVLVELGAQGLAVDAWLAAEAILALSAVPGARVWVDTLMELDRTMDAAGGLLDRMCNPLPAFRVLQTLNTVLFGARNLGSVLRVDRRAFGVKATLDGGTMRLVLPGIEPGSRSQLQRDIAGCGDLERCDLVSGWVHARCPQGLADETGIPTEPYLLMEERA